MKAFQDRKHERFFLTGGRTGALMVHGFPGTPAEMRPLAESLHGAGLTVEGLLLPGFGAQIESLHLRHHREWIEAVTGAMKKLRESCDRVILVGYSMGAAISLNVACEEAPPDGLLMLAPFWQLGERWQQPIWPLIRMVVRDFKPFEKADLSDPRVRSDLANFMPDADFDDPETVGFIRGISLPISLLDQVRSVGLAAWRVAGKVRTPAVIVQGTDDEIVPPARTRRLARRLNSDLEYHEIPADHHLIRPQQNAFGRVEEIALDFARRFQTD